MYRPAGRHSANDAYPFPTVSAGNHPRMRLKLPGRKAFSIAATVSDPDGWRNCTTFCSGRPACASQGRLSRRDNISHSSPPGLQFQLAQQRQQNMSDHRLIFDITTSVIPHCAKGAFELPGCAACSGNGCGIRISLN